MWAIEETQLKAGVEHPTEDHVYIGNEHHDKVNMGHNQGIDIKPLSIF
jgi:hypothetical protein